jgi:tetratricopeptide (TPR) repeat protein
MREISLRLLSILLLFFALIPLSFVEILANDVNSSIDVAEKYYWLGLEEKGSMGAFNSGLDYLATADSLLELSKSHANEKSELLTKISSLRQDLELQIELAHDTYEGVFPLRKVISSSIFLDAATYNTYELVDDPEVTALVSAAIKLRNSISTSGIKVPQFHTIFVDQSNSRKNENEALCVFNEDAKFYVHNYKDLTSVLNNLELNDVYKLNITESILAKLSAAFHSADILLTSINQVDFTDNKIFFNLTGYYFNSDQANPVFTSTSMGFCRDSNQVFFPVIFVNIFLFFLSLALFFFLKNHKEESPGKIMTSIHLPITAFLIGRVFPVVFFSIADTLSPPAVNLAILSFWWPLIVGSIVLIGPLILYKIVMSRLNLLHHNEHSEIIYISIPFGIVAFFSAPILLLKGFSGLPLLLLIAVALTLSSYIFAKSINDDDLETGKGYSFLHPVFSAALALAMFSADALYISVVTIVIAVLCIAVILLIRSGAKQDQKTETEREAPPSAITDSIEHLKSRIRNPKYVKFDVHERAYSKLKRNAILGLYGPAGRGKSALAEALVNEAAKNAEILRAECPEILDGQASHTPYFPFQAALSAKYDVQLTAPAQSQMKNLNSVVDGLFESVVPFSGLLFPPKEVDENIASSQIEMQISILKMLRKISREKALVLYFDDIQWIDSSSHELLKFIIDKIVTHKLENVSIILCSRTQEAFCDLAIENIDEFCFEIDAMSNKDKIQLLQQSLGLSSGVSCEIVENLSKESGELHWLFEVVRYLLSENLLIIENNHVAWSADFDPKNGLPIPPSLRKMLEEKLDDYPQYVEILMSAACYGKDFRVSVLSDCIDKSKLQTIKCLDEIEALTGFVYDEKANDDFYTFSSSFMLETLRDRFFISGEGLKALTVPQIIREFHARIAASLERSSDNSLAHIFDIAKHYYAAGISYAKDGYRCCLQASRSCQAQYSYSDAEIYLDMAEECASRIGKTDEIAEEKSILELNNIHTTQNEQRRLVAENWLSRIEAGQSTSNRLMLKITRACFDAAMLNHDQEFFAQTRKLSERLIDIANDDIEKAEGLQFYGLSVSPADGKSLSEAFKLIRDISVTNIPAMKLKGRIMNSLAESLLNSRNDDPAIRNAEREKGRSLLEERVKINADLNLGDKPGLARSYGGLGRYFFSRDEPDYEKALEYFKMDLQLSRDIGDITGEAKMNSSIGGCELGLSNYKSALSSYSRALGLSIGSGDKYFAYAGIFEAAYHLKDENTISRNSISLLNLIQNLENTAKINHKSAAFELKKALYLCEKFIEKEQFELMISYVKP